MASSHYTSPACSVSVTDCSQCGDLCLGAITLPCGDLSCRKCCRHLLQQHGEPHLTCRSCGQHLPLPKGCSSVRQVTEHLGVDPVVDYLVQQQLVSQVECKCEVHQNTDATKICEDCHDYFCDTCSDVHSRQTATNDHVLRQLATALHTPSTFDAPRGRPRAGSFSSTWSGVSVCNLSVASTDSSVLGIDNYSVSSAESALRIKITDDGNKEWKPWLEKEINLQQQADSQQHLMVSAFEKIASEVEEALAEDEKLKELLQTYNLFWSRCDVLQQIDEHTYVIRHKVDGIGVRVRTDVLGRRLCGFRDKRHTLLATAVQRMSRELNDLTRDDGGTRASCAAQPAFQSSPVAQTPLSTKPSYTASTLSHTSTNTRLASSAVTSPQALPNVQPASAAVRGALTPTNPQPSAPTKTKPQMLSDAQPASSASTSAQTSTILQPTSSTGTLPVMPTDSAPASTTLSRAQTLTTTQPVSITVTRAQTPTNAQPVSSAVMKTQIATHAQPVSSAATRTQAPTSAKPVSSAVTRTQAPTNAQPVSSAVTRTQTPTTTQPASTTVPRVHTPTPSQPVPSVIPRAPTPTSTQPAMPTSSSTPPYVHAPYAAHVVTATPRKVFVTSPTSADVKKPVITSIACTPDEKLIMTDCDNNKVKLVDLSDPRTVSASLTVREKPRRLAVLSDGLIAVTTYQNAIYLLKLIPSLTVAYRIYTSRLYVGVADGLVDQTLLASCFKTDTDHARVDVITREGYVVRTLVDSIALKDLWEPYCLSVSGGCVFVSGWWANCVYKVDVTTGLPVDTLTQPYLESPRQVCADVVGNIYIASGEGHCVLVRSIKKMWRLLLYSPDHKEQGCDWPCGVCVTRSGRLVVVWTASDRSVVIGYDLTHQ